MRNFCINWCTQPTPVLDKCPLKCNAPIVTPSNGSGYQLQSVVLFEHGDFDRIKVQRTTFPEGVPDNHVEVEVYYCGLNFTDNYLRLGIIRSDNFPLIMGSECAGVVVGVGSGITDIKVGQRVLCLKMHGGLFRHYVHIPRSNCFVIPDEIKMREAVCLGLDFVVAHMCLFEMAHVKETDCVFIQSIAGGVGTSMIQLLRALLGAKVTIYGTAAEGKHFDAEFLGATRVFKHEEDYVKKIGLEYAGGVDIAINSNGGADIKKLMKLLRPFGRLINIGSNSTAIDPKPEERKKVTPSWDTTTITIREIMEGNRKIGGVNIADLIQAFPEKVEAILKETYQLFLEQKIRTRVHNIVPFDKVTTAMKYMCTRENVGKVMMVLKNELRNPPEVPTPLAVRMRKLKEEEEAASRHEVDKTPGPQSAVSSPVTVPSEDPCHQREESGSHHDGEVCSSQTEKM